MNEGTGAKTRSGQFRIWFLRQGFEEVKVGLKVYRQRQGGTFLREHSIPKEREAEMEGGRHVLVLH